MLIEITPYLWICISVAAAVVEVLTLSKTAVWFVPAGLFVFFLAIFEVDVWIQVAVFIIISLILIGLSRVMSKNFINFVKFKETKEIKEYKNLIGKAAIVTEEIDNIKNTGSVRINGTIWTARAEDADELYENGLIVTIIKIDGECVICSR